MNTTSTTRSGWKGSERRRQDAKVIGITYAAGKRSLHAYRSTRGAVV
jgi:hypothetical protein